MTFGKKLATLRKQANMTQKELAKQLKVSRQAITKWERDNGIPDIDNILKISILFDISVNDLFNYKIEKFPYPPHHEERVDRKNFRFKNIEQFVVKRFQNADHLYWLFRERKFNVWEWFLDFFLGAGTLEVADVLRTGLVYSLLAETADTYQLILIYKDKMVIKQLTQPFEKGGIVLDGYKYSKTKKIF